MWKERILANHDSNKPDSLPHRSDSNALPRGAKFAVLVRVAVIEVTRAVLPMTDWGFP